MPAPFQEHARIVRRLDVTLVGGKPRHAGAKTTLDVILQTRPRMAAREVHGARRDHKTFVNEVQNAAREARRKIRSKVERAILLDAAGEINARILLCSSEFDVGIGLVVAEQDIELWAVFLDEVVFEGQGFALVADRKSVVEGRRGWSGGRAGALREGRAGRTA